jgi:hypothetical protein
MTLQQFQNCTKINNSLFDEIDKLALTICEVYSFTPDEVDSFSSRKFLKYSKKIEKLFGKGFNKPFYSRSDLETNAKNITFGQFIECQEWLKSEPIEVLHLIAASIHNGERNNHQELSEKMLQTNVSYLLTDCLTFVNSFAELIDKYKNLFDNNEVDEDESLDDIKKKEKLKRHPFIEFYGWEFSATQVAEHNRITLNEAYQLPVVEALNNLAYLKSKQDYEQKQNK